MGGFSLWHWLVIIIVVMILFGGRGKISELMGDVAKGIKNFRKGMEDEKPQIQQQTPPPVSSDTTNIDASKV